MNKKQLRPGSLELGQEVPDIESLDTIEGHTCVHSPDGTEDEQYRGALNVGAIGSLGEDLTVVYAQHPGVNGGVMHFSGVILG